MSDDTRSKLGQNFYVHHHASLHTHVCLYSSCLCDNLQTVSAVV